MPDEIQPIHFQFNNNTTLAHPDILINFTPIQVSFNFRPVEELLILQPPVVLNNSSVINNI